MVDVAPQDGESLTRLQIFEIKPASKEASLDVSDIMGVDANAGACTPDSILESIEGLAVGNAVHKEVQAVE